MDNDIEVLKPYLKEGVEVEYTKEKGVTFKTSNKSKRLSNTEIADIAVGIIKGLLENGLMIKQKKAKIQ